MGNSRENEFVFYVEIYVNKIFDLKWGKLKTGVCCVVFGEMGMG